MNLMTYGHGSKNVASYDLQVPDEHLLAKTFIYSFIKKCYRSAKHMVMFVSQSMSQQP